MKYIIALGLFCCASTSVFAGALLPPAKGCPSGWIGDGACKLLPGEQKCRTGYDCVSNFCCQQPNAKVKQCPQGQIKVFGSCGQNSNPSDPALECPTGSTCYNGICCRSAVTPQCPNGEVQIPGECEDLSRSPVGRAPFPTCPTPATCYNGICCQARTTGSIRKCPDGQTQVPGTCLSTLPVKREKRPVPKCPKGSRCIEGLCCRPDSLPKCRKGYTQVLGQCPECPRGSRCFNGVCCRRDPEGRCKKGDIKVSGVCPQCPQGSTCYNGVCCQSVKKPKAQCPRIRNSEENEERQRSLCRANKNNPDECKTNADCLNQGSLCCLDKCRRKYCYSPFTTTTSTTTTTLPYKASPNK